MPEHVETSKHRFYSPKFQSVVQEAVSFFDTTPNHWLPPSRFVGAGIYALYYVGDSSLYESLAAINRETLQLPIYVGKAVPQGWRTGRVADTEKTNLHGRLSEHAKSIRLAENLQIEDFRCRFVILGGPEADLIGPVEAELIRRYRPLWNNGVAGFGIHHPGSGRYDQARSEWDVLHPGRGFAALLTGQSVALHLIEDKVKAYMAALNS
jgi:hypothetical protein